MNLSARQLQESDYENILLGWWSDWGWVAPEKDMLPENGTGGIIIFCDDVPVCSGFLYTTNSGIAWVEFIVSNKNFTNRSVRLDALNLLINSLSNVAKTAGHKYAYTILKNQSLMNRFKDIGYIKGDSDCFEMIKHLK
jgi:hypothetical protein